MEPWIVKEVLLSAAMLGISILLPILLPIVLAYFVEKEFPRRLLYVGVVFTLTYGLCMWLSLITAPFAPIMDYLVPTMEIENSLTRPQEEAIRYLRWYQDKEFFILIAVQLGVGVSTSIYLRRRWRAIVAALG